MGEIVGRVGAAVLLLSLAALFSGLTLGMLSLDVQQLEIVREAGTPEERRNAALILPVRAQGNLLLCTLVLGNVAVTSMEAILLADLTSGLMGFFLSTVLVVIFGEIIPQAICARYALVIGGRAVPIINVLLFVLYPFTKPLSACLDYALGEEIGHSYSRAEFSKLVSIQVSSKTIAASEALIIGGALTFRSKTVRAVATPVERMFAVSASDVLDYELMELIFRTGYSRVPVWDDRRESIIGVLYAKDLVLVTPEQRQPVISVVHFFNRANVNVCDDEELLDSVLKLFIRSRQHFAVVRTVDSGWGEGDPVFRVAGIITMEDIMEEIIGQQLDDDDSGRAREPLRVASAARLNALQGGEESPFRLPVPFSSSTVPKVLAANGMSDSEVRATAAHLITNVHTFATARASFADVVALVSASDVQELGDGEGVYESGVPTNFTAIVLRGKMELTAMPMALDAPPTTSIVTIAGPWAVLCESALVSPPHLPSFSARAPAKAAGVAILRITHAAFVRLVAKDAAALMSKNKVTSSGSGSGSGSGGAAMMPQNYPAALTVPTNPGHSHSHALPLPPRLHNTTSNGSLTPTRASTVTLQARGDMVPAEHYVRARNPAQNLSPKSASQQRSPALAPPMPTLPHSSDSSHPSPPPSQSAVFGAAGRVERPHGFGGGSGGSTNFGALNEQV